MFHEFLILDGGLASELERRGADLRDPLWSAKLLFENPDLIRQVHLDYFLAGADVGTCASYQASYLGFSRRGIEPKDAADLMRLSVRLVREARDRFMTQAPAGRSTPLVAASVGCYGASLADGSEYRGLYELEKDELIDWHRPRIETLLRESPDLLACETIPCVREAEALAELLSEFPSAPAWVSFCCRDGERLSSGEPLTDAVAALEATTNVTAVGVNCVAPHHAAELISTIRRATTKRIVAYPNRGETWDAAAKTWLPSGLASDWGELGKVWYHAGATLIGGCCRTTPDDIRRLRETIRVEPPKPR